MSDKETIVFFAIVQTSAVIGSFFFGFVTDKFGPKRTITVTLVLWIAITVGSLFCDDSIGVLHRRTGRRRRDRLITISK